MIVDTCLQLLVDKLDQFLDILDSHWQRFARSNRRAELRQRQKRQAVIDKLHDESLRLAMCDTISKFLQGQHRAEGSLTGRPRHASERECSFQSLLEGGQHFAFTSPRLRFEFLTDEINERFYCVECENHRHQRRV